ncbi:MAG: 50S ribosomal protein L9 [Patescibacteria group bacterium]
MKVILLKDVSKLGRKYEVKTVSDGHALNLLIPQKIAIAATPDALKRMETERMKTEGEKKVHEELLVKNLKDLDGKVLTISGKANDKGHLFAGLNKEMIVTELQKQTQLQVSAEAIVMEHPIKEVGEHTIEVKAAGKSAKFKVDVKAL